MAKDKTFYVSNVELYKTFVDWNKELKKAKKKNEPEPDIPFHIVDSIMRICNKLAYRPNFYNYSYRDDMVGDALENCIRVAKNFDPAKSTNPFSFITTIAWHAFIRRIEAEKKQTYIKGKIIAEMPIEDLIEMEDHDEESMAMQNQYVEYLRENNFIMTQTMEAKKKKKVKKIEDDGLETFMSSDDLEHEDDNTTDQKLS